MDGALRDLENDQIQALAVRTLPNDESKKNRRYGDSCRPPFFSLEAMHALIDRGIEHVLVDIPSLDKMHNEGRLTNHHLFWNVPAEGHALTADTKISKTITEMIFVPNEVRDGCYLLDLQLPAFTSDAAPSGPVIYPLEPVHRKVRCCHLTNIDRYLMMTNIRWRIQMDQHFTKAALTRFLDTVTQKGLVNANTANGWRAACTRILEDVGDGEDVRSLDLPTAVKRYNNRHPGDLSPSSLKEYERRLGLVLKEFTSYVNDPAAYKGRGRGIGKQNGDRGARTARRGNKTPVVDELARPEIADNARPIVTPGLSLEFPMRPDFLAQVVIPRDMKVDEAKRLSRFILTLAQDFQPNDNGG